MPQSGRHAAPRDPARSRTVLLPSVLLVAAGAAFGGMAIVPAAAADAPRVTAAAALAPVELAAAPVPADANRALMATLQKGLAAAAPKPVAKPAPVETRAPARASRSRSTATARTEGISGATWVRPGIGRLTSGYGRRWGRLHAGVDLASGIGSPVRAVGAATVLSARMEGGYGRCVRLQHADGTVTVYGHLSAFLVHAGERVAAGELIAREGNTGHSTGPHLHFEVRINGAPINPLPWLRKRGIAV